MSGLTLINISKKWKGNDVPTLQNIDLQVDNDEFVVLLGPSGSGKSTLLRIIAGLENPTGGKVLIDGADVTELEPQNRGVGMVFQNYALFPHMTIYKNLAFPLEVARIRRSERNVIIEKVSDLLGIRNHLKKKPHMLSGGERQRVAMGRAMVKESKVYLFDEPLSNLDDILRSRLRPEIMQLFQQLKIPFIYVTHDQVDAMTMATKIIVMDKGSIQQVGPPDEVYNLPANTFVAGFLGTPQINLLPFDIIREENRIHLSRGEFNIDLPEWQGALLKTKREDVILGIRPEDFLIGEYLGAGESLVPLKCTLCHFEHLGNKLNLFVSFLGVDLNLTLPIDVRAKVGQELTVYMDLSKAHLFDTETGMRLQSI